MSALAWLIPCALVLGGLGLVGFLWTLKADQYHDLEGAAWRALDDGPPTPTPTPQDSLTHRSDTTDARDQPQENNQTDQKTQLSPGD